MLHGFIQNIYFYIKACYSSPVPNLSLCYKKLQKNTGTRPNLLLIMTIIRPYGCIKLLQAPSYITSDRIQASRWSKPVKSMSGLVPWLRIKLVADVVYDLRYILVKVVELIHKEGVIFVWVCGNVFELILCSPGNADGVGNHTWSKSYDMFNV